MTKTEDQQLVSISSIAERTGLKVPTVSNWRRRDDTFPQAAAGTSTRPLFSLEEVKEWILKTGKNVQFQERSAVQPLADLLRGRYDTAEYHQVLFSLLALARWVQSNDQSPLAETSKDDFIKLANLSIASLSQDRPLVATAIEQLLSESKPPCDEDLFANVFSKIYAHGNPGQLAAELTDLVRQTSWIGGAEHLSTPAFSDFLVALLPRGGSDFADFGSGYGQTLSTAASLEPNWSLTGLDINVQANQIAACLLYTNGVSAELCSKDVLRSAHEESFDRITFHAPFGMRLNDEDLQAIAWPFGKPPRSNADAAWPQVAYRSLRQDGCAVVVVATSVLTRGSTTRDILKRMVSQGAIEAVISLPGKTQINTAIPVSILVLRKNGAPSEVLMIDTAQAAAGTIQNAKDTDVADAYAKAIASLEAWRQQGTPDSEISAAVPLTELLAPDAVLLPQRWLLTVEAPDKNKHVVEEVNASYRALADAVQQQPELPSLLPVAETPQAAPLHALTEVGTVVRGDFSSTRNSAADTTTSPKVQVVTIGTVRNGHSEERTSPARTAKKSPVTTQAGDILITTTGPINARVWDEEGLAVDKNVTILRDFSPAWDPYYVASQITAENNQAMLTGITIKRVDVKQLLVAQLSLEAQQAIGQAVRDYSAFADAARNTATKAEEHLAALQNSVSSGTVSPA
ncbi:N-6 DNA methylase [Glutamicibacter arilaitensis]|uniref:N-6 DNA methylase n=1 Tax=Glutamicibacter arilaitensis TaxID=256701 RepID=UPI003FD284A4